MTDQPDHGVVSRRLRSDLDVDVDGERDATEGEIDEGLPSRLDASFEEPVPDAIDQRREVLLETDGYET